MSEKELKIKNLEAKSSIHKLADNLISGTKKFLGQARTEEDLKVGFEKLLEAIKSSSSKRSIVNLKV